MQKLLFLSLTGCLVFGSPSYAQQNITEFTGKIVNNAGRPVARASLRADSLGITGICNEDGTFRLVNIPAGTHRVIITAVGYRPDSLRVTLPQNDATAFFHTLQDETKELEEIVVSARSEKKQKENSSEAVTVIEMKEARFRSGDLGQLMAQTQGISVRTNGGLGSNADFSLNGLNGNQIRFFMDGVPLDLMGYVFGFSTVPVNAVERIEVYKGVVPATLGADALGGAVNIVTQGPVDGMSGAASYQTGSFGTNRTLVSIGYARTGWFVKGEGFYDNVRNNYKINVDIADEKGKVSEVTVPRFHDRYQAGGGNLTMGLTNKKWARELSLNLFFNRFSKQIQHNNLMSGIPYGEVMSHRSAPGGVLKYRLGDQGPLTFRLSSGYSRSTREFADTSRYAYNWYGERIRVRNRPGEIGGGTGGSSGATHAFTYTGTAFSRLVFDWKVLPAHHLAFSSSPTLTYRSGNDRLLSSYDPLNARRNLLSWVNGLTYTSKGDREKFESTAFIKHYLQRIRSREPGGENQYSTSFRQVNYWGAGGGIRYRWSPVLLAKLSYEYATRLPQTDELFGDGQFTLENMSLKPERSHNINAELFYTRSSWKLHGNFFIRSVRNLILFVPGAERTSIYQNVLAANSIGGELEGEWKSSDKKLSISANVTYQDFYNNSTEGIFALFYRDRIPNRPYFFTNSTLTRSFPELFHNSGRLSSFLQASYIHSFYRSWESAGLKEYRTVIPGQQLYNLGITYQHNTTLLSPVLSLELQNLTNRRNYDYYGVQKPGRAIYLKLTTQF